MRHSERPNNGAAGNGGGVAAAALACCKRSQGACNAGCGVIAAFCGSIGVFQRCRGRETAALRGPPAPGVFAGHGSPQADRGRFCRRLRLPGRAGAGVLCRHSSPRSRCPPGARIGIPSPSTQQQPHRHGQVSPPTPCTLPARRPARLRGRGLSVRGHPLPLPNLQAAFLTSTSTMKVRAAQGRSASGLHAPMAALGRAAGAPRAPAALGCTWNAQAGEMLASSDRPPAFPPLPAPCVSPPSSRSLHVQTPHLLIVRCS